MSDHETRLGAGNLPRVVVTLCLGLVLVGCASYEAPEIVSGTANEVVVRAGSDTNPGPLAADHCAKYDRKAALRGSEPIGRRSPWKWDPVIIRLFHFDCVR